MEYIVHQNKSTNLFILCNESEYKGWATNREVFVKDPSNLNYIINIMGFSKIIEPNSFLDNYYLDKLPAKACFEKMDSNFAYGLNDLGEESLGTIWEIYNSIESKNNPFLKSTDIPEFILKNKEDFKSETLYNYVKDYNETHIRFFSELFSTYSIFTMRPKYYDDESLNINIFKRNFYGEDIYCLCWTSDY